MSDKQKLFTTCSSSITITAIFPSAIETVE